MRCPEVGGMIGSGEQAPGTVTVSVQRLLQLLANRPRHFIVVGNMKLQELPFHQATAGERHPENFQVGSPEGKACLATELAAATPELLPLLQEPWTQVGDDRAQARLAAEVAKQTWEQHAAELAALSDPTRGGGR